VGKEGFGLGRRGVWKASLAHHRERTSLRKYEIRSTKKEKKAENPTTGILYFGELGLRISWRGGGGRQLGSDGREKWGDCCPDGKGKGEAKRDRGRKERLQGQRNERLRSGPKLVVLVAV